MEMNKLFNVTGAGWSPSPTRALPSSGNIWKFFGTYLNHRESVQVALAMLSVTVLYEYVSSLIPGYSFSVAEFLGTWTGLTCVWLTRTENILCWPWGIASVIALGFFFRDIGLPGQQWLNWGFFMVIQLWSWPYWVWGGKGGTELKVSFLSNGERVMWLGIIIVWTALVLGIISYFAPGSNYPWLDSLVVAASVVAQFLLGRKKVESWVLWFGPVNAVSIFLFALTGAYTLTALYLAFLVHAAIAIRSWSKEATANA